MGLAARERVHRLPKGKSRDQLAGSFCGRLRLTGELSEAQYQASVIYLEECHNNSIVCASPRQPGAVNLNAVRGSGALVPENVSWAHRCVEHYRDSKRAVQEKQNELRGMANLFGALSVCVLQDHEVMNLVGDLRYALSALARHYRLEGRGVFKEEAA